MNKRMRNKPRWNITVHYDRRPWLTLAMYQTKGTFNKLVHQAILDDTIELVHAYQIHYRKVRVSGGMFTIEKRKFRGFALPGCKPHFRGSETMRFFSSDEQLKRGMEAYERCYTHDEEEENE